MGNDPVNWSDASGEGKVKWFVETVTGTYKRVSERIARISASNGRNVDVVGPGASREANRMGKKVYGPTTRHEPHPSVPPDRKGHHQLHVQPKERGSGQTGHIFHRSAGVVAAGALASTLQGLGDAIGTAEDNVGPDASPQERARAQLWDFFDPASSVAEVLRMGAEIVRPKAESPSENEPCEYYKQTCRPR